MWLTLFLAVGLALPARQAVAADAAAPMARSPAFTAALARWVRDGRWTQALALLDGLPAAERSEPDILYLRAQVLRKVGKATQALDIYNRLLGLDPARQIIRLELAQTYYDLGDDRSSERFFRLALSGVLTAEDSALAHRYLAAITHRQAWRVSASLALGPDSNVNTGTDSRDVQVFGLPFQLSDAARRAQGFDVGGQVSAYRSIALGGPLRLQTTLLASGVATGKPAFDILDMGVQAGPQLVFGERTAALLAATDRFWFGGRELYTGAGGVLTGRAPLGSTTLIDASLAVKRLAYPHNPDYSAWLTSLSLQRTRFLSPTAFWRLTLGASSNQAGADYQTYAGGSVAAGYYRSLPKGFALYLEPAAALRAYRGLQPLLGARRRDVDVSVTVRLVKQDRTLFGFAPYIEGLAERNASTVSLYRFDRSRAQVGLSRTF